MRMAFVKDILSDYVNEDDGGEEQEPTPGLTPEPPAKQPVVKRRRRRRFDGEPKPVDEPELTRKRDILASVALFEGLEGYDGRSVSAVEVRKMKEEDLISLFRVYEERSGQELLCDSLSTVSEVIVRGLSFVLSFDDKEALKEDLLKNRQLNLFIARYVSRISEDYGDVVAILRLVFDITRHVVFDESKAPDPAEESCRTA